MPNRAFHAAFLRLAGHSHWHNIQHRKAKVDQERSRRFTKIVSEIKSAARGQAAPLCLPSSLSDMRCLYILVGGGSDPKTNPRLATALEKARAANLPKDKITDALNSKSDASEEVIVEVFGPEGVAFLVECVTDSRNRTMQEVRLLCKDSGVALQPTGATKSHLRLRGSVAVFLGSKTEDDLLMQATEVGAEDVDFTACPESETAKWALVYTDPSAVVAVKTLLEEAGFQIKNFERLYFPIMATEIDDSEAWEKVQNFAEKLEDLSDSINVYYNGVPSKELSDQFAAEEAEAAAAAAGTKKKK